MNQDDFQELLAEDRFTPFVITLTDGVIVPIGHKERKQIVVGRNMVVTLDQEGNLVHIPYRSIARIEEPG